MLDEWYILLVAVCYLAVLFGIAYYGDKRADAGRSIISNPYIYTLSIAVYCTAWTFYGSVGRAASTGVGFLPIYLGPTLMLTLGWLVLRKIVRIAKVHRVTSIADLIGSRYGKSALLGGLVSVIAVVGVMPYISLQLKAVSTSYNVIRHYPAVAMPEHSSAMPFWTDTALYVALLMALFAILFGTRHIETTERHEGVVAAIAFESLVKLIAFLAVGVFVTFGLFGGFEPLFAQAASRPELARLMTLEVVPGGAWGWFFLTLVSMGAIVFLPRQFQVAVVENVNEDHIRRAAWLFPLYLLAINVFVLPVALAGRLLFPEGGVDPDTFVLMLPMLEHYPHLALFVFLGGLSAATSMVIVATIALSTMVCNDLIMPVLLRLEALRLRERADLTRLLLAIRRGSIVFVLLLGYLYFRLIGESFALVSIGLVSFAAVAQFAPPILLGIYWRGASRQGAMVGLVAGFVVWAYTLLLPSVARSGWLPAAFIEEGLLGVELLKPYALLGLTGLSPLSHSLFWSMLANVGGLVVVSLFTRQSPMERMQGVLFVDVFRQGVVGREGHFWRGTTTVSELHVLLARFLGRARADEVLARYARERGIALDAELVADQALIDQVERLLAGAIGAASARVMISSTVKGEALSVDAVMQILDETSQVMQYSRRLEQKSRELEAATRELRMANERLQELDRLKDEFVSTVSHELRTPLTSIRAFSEILRDNPNLSGEQRQGYLDIVVKETERLTRLINEVLDLAKIESGRMEWRMQRLDLRDLIQDAVAAVSQLFRERRVDLSRRVPQQACYVNGDRDHLMQVLINLLSNASKFSEPDTGRVAVRLDGGGERFTVQVTDNGTGIPPQALAHIFEKFHQVSAPERGKPAGTGLGLAICKGIVEHHGGRIWALSELGRGTTIGFELPELAVMGDEVQPNPVG